MSRENVQILKAAYEALNRGDVAAALGVLEADAEWAEHSELPEADTYRGLGAIRTFLDGYLESWEEFRQETEEMMDGADKVAVFLHLIARGKGSGIEVEARYAHVWTMRDGRGVRVDAYGDRQMALEALHQTGASSPGRD